MAEEEAESPGEIYNVYVIMESMQDKLKLLNYEKYYCKELHQKPLTRHYFAIPTNPGEQFYAFSSLAAWLIRSKGGQMDAPQEFDDPNATISTIISEIKSTGETFDFPPAKLKQGSGFPCVIALSILCEAALKNKHFSWALPDYSKLENEEDNDEINAEEDDKEDDDDDDWWKERGKDFGGKIKKISNNDLDGDEIEEEEMDFDDGENNSMENTIDVKKSANRRVSFSAANSNEATQANEFSRPENILESNTDISDWLLEVERVLPHLKVTIRNENKDWRTRIDQMKTLKNEIDKNYVDTKSHLERLQDELSRQLDKINSREKYLNSNLDQLLTGYRVAQDHLSESKEKYRQASVGITDRSRVLADLTDELERIKQEMDDRGSSMTDGSPVVRIRQAIQRLKQEMKQMDVRAGVLVHILLQARIRAKADANKFHQITNASTDANYVI